MRLGTEGGFIPLLANFIGLQLQILSRADGFSDKK